MMAEADLVKKIQELKQIKPRKDWVVLTKSQILGSPLKQDRVLLISFFPRYRLVFVPVLTVFILIGLFVLSQNSLPGDFLYSLKKITEKSQVVFVSENEKPKLNFELANKRLEELTKIAETNQVIKLVPAIEEVKASMKEVAKSLPKKMEKEIVFQTKKLEEQKQKIESLGVVIEKNEEFDNTLAQLVENEIKDLENRTLNEKQQTLLFSAKEDFEAGNYSQALEKILILSYYNTN